MLCAFYRPHAGKIGCFGEGKTTVLEMHDYGGRLRL